MTQIKNSTYDTSAATRGDTEGFPTLPLLLSLATLLAFAVRAQRLEWQPLWWDEGYSVFFATEPLAKMLALTAQDIHPPFYYAALHGWFALLGGASPAISRLFSVGAGTIAVPLLGVLVSRLTRGNLAASFTAAFLLAMNPMHVYYSQEIRMYSLAASLGLASALCLVIWVNGMRAGRSPSIWLAAFVALTALLLHTLYYAAILVAIHFAWAAWQVRTEARPRRSLLIGAIVAIALSLPWWVYAAPKLMAYVTDKVRSDQDVSLGFIDYVLRHLTVFIAGHEQPVVVSNLFVLLAGGLAVLPFVLAIRNIRGSRIPEPDSVGPFSAIALLTVVTTGALLFGFTMNMRYPFFPENGERLLLFVLPFLIAVIAWGQGYGRGAQSVRLLLLTPILLLSLTGLITYYAQPRHVESDYRPIVSQVEQWGANSDTVLALFPWQVGYWRAYGQRNRLGQLISPQPASVGQGAMLWSDTLRSRIDKALDAGTLWFPEPLALGSSLPHEVEEYLVENALNVENRWQTAATRLTAWAERAQNTSLGSQSVEFGPVTLTGSQIWPDTIASDNSVLNVALGWSADPQLDGIQVALKLLDGEGRAWTERDYTPPGRFDCVAYRDAGVLNDVFGILVPGGMPPGTYTVTVSVADQHGLQYPVHSDGDMSPSYTVALQEIAVVAPSRPVSQARIAIDHRVDGTDQKSDVVILGVSAVGETPVALAGDDLNAQIVLQNRYANAKDDAISVELVDRDGGSIAQWEGWPLPDYPMQTWPVGAVTRVPVTLQMPADVEEGTYELIASVLRLSEGVRFPPRSLTEVTLTARRGAFEPVEPAIPLAAPMQFGTHARLLGFDAVRDGSTMQLSLTWEVLQPLRPLHHIFVHVADAQGKIVAQQDGPPISDDGQAPTGGWRTGEYVTTQHSISLPPQTEPDESVDPYEFRIGLYDPKSGVRLPAFLGGEPSGDTAVLVIDQ